MTLQKLRKFRGGSPLKPGEDVITRREIFKNLMSFIIFPLAMPTFGCALNPAWLCILLHPEGAPFAALKLKG
jgi:hypothetical protein